MNKAALSFLLLYVFHFPVAIGKVLLFAFGEAGNMLFTTHHVLLLQNKQNPKLAIFRGFLLFQYDFEAYKLFIVKNFTSQYYYENIYSLYSKFSYL